MNIVARVITFSIALTAATAAWSAEPIVYPADGQDAAQQNKDEGECLLWAKDRSGFDPFHQPNAQTAQAEKKSGGALRGAAGGAAVGAIVGNSDDAKKGAAAGAVLGRIRQNRKNRESNKEAQTQAATAQASANVTRDEFDRSYAACLEGRRYTVR